MKIPYTDLVYTPDFGGGVTLRLEREPAAFRPDGTIANAGEYWQHRLAFYHNDKRCGPLLGYNPYYAIPNMPGDTWTQAELNGWVNETLRKLRRELKAEQERRERELAVAEARRKRNEDRRRIYLDLFTANAIPAKNTHKGRYVLDKDGRMWKTGGNATDGLQVALFAATYRDGVDGSKTASFVDAATPLWMIKRSEYPRISKKLDTVPPQN